MIQKWISSARTRKNEVEVLILCYTFLNYYFGLYTTVQTADLSILRE